MVVVRLAIAALLVAASSHAAEADDLAVVRERITRSWLPVDATGVAEFEKRANEYAKSLQTDGSWADVDYADQRRHNWAAQQHLDRLLLLARAQRVRPDDRRLHSIKLTLDYWLKRDPQNPNWWHNEIGVPQMVGTVALLLRDELSREQLAGVSRILRRANWSRWTGQNLVWGATNQIMLGLVENDASLVSPAYARLYEEIRITNREGIQADYSFHQHGPQFYSGGYGLAFAQDVPRYVSFAWRTQWQIPDERMQILNGFLLDGEQWMMHGPRMDYLAMGREITRKGKTAVPMSDTGGPIVPVGRSFGLLRSIELLADQCVPRRDKLRAFTSRMRRDPSAIPLVGNRHFYRSDYTAHHRPGWFASVRMFSSRLLNGEFVNGEGSQSVHLADGASLLYVTGDEYRDVFPVWDWTKVPGTTAEQNTLDVEPPKSVGVKGKTRFVGGVSDGTVGLAAMGFARGKLTARKVFAFFDDGYVCLGAGISCDSDNPVATTVNQCRLNGEVKKGGSWIWHDNVGYIFPNRAQAKLETGLREGRWSNIGAGSDELVRENVFNLWLDHGTRPNNATYAYEVFPGVDAAQVADRHAKPRYELATNTSAQQAVFDLQTKVLLAAFWEAGEVRTPWTPVLSVDQPCLIIIRQEADKAFVTACNPENAPMKLSVRLGEKSTTFELPDGAKAGSSVTQSIE